MSASSSLPAWSRLLAAAAVAVGVSTVAAWAGDFTKACEDNSALDTGKLADKDKQSCACIKAKLDGKTQGAVGSVLEKLLAQRKAGKGNQKPDMTPDEEKAMGAFVGGMRGCVTANQ